MAVKIVLYFNANTKLLDFFFKLRRLSDTRLKPWSNGLASTSRKLKTWVFLRLCLARPCVHLRWLACKFDFDQSDRKSSQVNASARKAWPNGVASRSKFSNCDYLRVRLTGALHSIVFLCRIFQVRPVSNVVLLPCRTQMKLSFRFKLDRSTTFETCLIRIRWRDRKLDAGCHVAAGTWVSFTAKTSVESS